MYQPFMIIALIFSICAGLAASSAIHRTGLHPRPTEVEIVGTPVLHGCPQDTRVVVHFDFKEEMMYEFYAIQFRFPSQRKLSSSTGAHTNTCSATVRVKKPKGMKVYRLIMSFFHL
jgi:hypothetical protein